MFCAALCNFILFFLRKSTFHFGVPQFFTFLFCIYTNFQYFIVYVYDFIFTYIINISNFTNYIRLLLDNIYITNKQTK